jgi:hypothetical protein
VSANSHVRSNRHEQIEIHMMHASGHEPVAAVARARFALTEGAESYQTAAPGSREVKEVTTVHGTAIEPLSIAVLPQRIRMCRCGHLGSQQSHGLRDSLTCCCV